MNVGADILRLVSSELDGPEWRSHEEVYGAVGRRARPRWAWGTVRQTVLELVRRGEAERRWRSGDGRARRRMEYRLRAAAAKGGEAVP